MALVAGSPLDVRWIYALAIGAAWGAYIGSWIERREHAADLRRLKLLDNQTPDEAQARADFLRSQSTLPRDLR